jgi:hypothetical protein
MVKRLFFDGIDVGGNDLSVGIGVQFALDVLPDAANAKFGVGDFAVVIAQHTVDHLSINGLVEHRIFKHRDSGWWVSGVRNREKMRYV